MKKAPTTASAQSRKTKPSAKPLAPSGAEKPRRAREDAEPAPARAKTEPAKKSGEREEEGEKPRKIKAEAAAQTQQRSDSIPPPPSAPRGGPWRSYKEEVAALAQRIVDAQRPIRVLQSLKWDASVEERFFKNKCRELPQIGAEDYAKSGLGYEPQNKIRELEEIAADIERALGKDDAIGQIMLATALEYRDVVRMLEARGTKMFYAYSRKLYGSPKDRFPDGQSTVRELGHVLYEILTRIDDASLGGEQPRDLSGEQCAAILHQRFSEYFGDDAVRVQVDDELLSDAAAGSTYVKVRSSAKFSMRDIDILEAHEGWVHVATSLNGQQQTVARWLSKGPPRTTAVQEGLAALVEIFTFRTYPRRARRLNDRIIAIDKAEDGASFLDVFEWLRTEGLPAEECFANARRVFRGGTVEGCAPFTKDAAYCKGIVLNYAFIRSAIRHNHADLIPYLFTGKLAHEDVPVLARRVADGVVKPPRYVPSMFRDLNGLAIWMAYSTFFSRLSDEQTSDHYAKIFRNGQ